MLERKILCLSLKVKDQALEDSLRNAGWDVVACSDVADVQRLIDQHRCAVAVIMLGQAEALDDSEVSSLTTSVHASLHTEWVGLLGQPALESRAFRTLVVECLVDYQVQTDHCLPQWGDVERMVGNAYQRILLRLVSQKTLTITENCLGMVGKSSVMVQMRRQIRKVAAASAPVLICGESGSGKELAAKAIHAGSQRKQGRLVEVNCGAIAPSLIHSELFGYVRGAFTGALADRQGLIEAADRGTIFLDEIGDLPMALQANLLRFLQEKTIQRVGSVRSTPVDVRVVAASHVNLATAVAQGHFREDLFYRLNVLAINVPPLRDRMEDVPLLAQHFLRLCAADRPKRLEGFGPQALAAMAAHTWPGNVRELHNCVQRAVVMADQRWISPADLGLEQVVIPERLSLDAARMVAEREVISNALARAGFNVTHAARELEVSRMTLYRLMEKHGIASEAATAAAERPSPSEDWQSPVRTRKPTSVPIRSAL